MDYPHVLSNITHSMVEGVRTWIWRRSHFKTITDVSEEMPSSALSAIPPNFW